MKILKSRFTMKPYNRIGFWDNVNGKKVDYFIDCYGDIFMSQGHGIFLPFSFRVKVKNDNITHKELTIDLQVKILKEVLTDLLTVFDSEEDKMDFILDICNGYKKKINEI